MGTARGEPGSPTLHNGVWPQNAATVSAFLSVASQWRVAAIGGGMAPFGGAPGRLVHTGLDYAGVRAGLDAAAIEVTPELWGGLQVMEAAARDALNE